MSAGEAAAIRYLSANLARKQRHISKMIDRALVGAAAATLAALGWGMWLVAV